MIADCTGDNAGDSVGPTADGFETYGVTGVALITFLAMALGQSNPIVCGQLIIWIFAMRILMILTSMCSFFINQSLTKSKYGQIQEFDAEKPLTSLVWITSIISIVVTFIASLILLPPSKFKGLWWVLSIIISCGTIAGALIPEFTKFFTSTNSRHVQEVVTSAKQGGASLDILSGFVAGNFSAFWEGFLILILMVIASAISTEPVLVNLMPKEFPFAASIFAFGLVAFGFLGMGPVTIAVDSFGPVSDNAQSVYELSRIEAGKGSRKKLKKNSVSNPILKRPRSIWREMTAPATPSRPLAKPVLIGTAVVGATTMVFGIILLLEHVYGNVVNATAWSSRK